MEHKADRAGRRKNKNNIMIFYLSCTGNTLWAANELNSNTGGELVNMAEHANTRPCWYFKPGERIGFCFPVHGWRPPRLVRDFIRKLKVVMPPGTYCYAVCTAGDTTGEAIDILKQDLAEVGIPLHSAFSLQMPNTYVGLPFMDVDPIEVQQRKKQRAAEDLKRYINYIMEKREGVFEVKRGRWPRINSRILGALFLKYLVTDKPFRIDESMCLNCGRCVSACPVGDLRYSHNTPPRWRNNGTCMTCFACYHHCPYHGISYGLRTKRKGQYFFYR